LPDPAARRERIPATTHHPLTTADMADPFLSDVTLLARFGEQSMKFFPVVQAIKNSVSSGLNPGWHTATITFKLDEQGDLIRLDEYKVSSLGNDKL
jgi:hypothetical protein